MMQERTLVCSSCGKESQHLAGRMPCEELSGWFMVSHLKGRESVEQYCFCSVACLYQWSGSRVTRVPDVFLKSFREEDT